jgi:multidrug efflux pump subunit AcrB
MRKYVVFLVLATLLINCLLIGQEDKRITIIIPKDQSIERDTLKALKSEFEQSKLVDSVSLKGLSYLAIMIEPYQDDLLRYHLTNKYIHNKLKQKLAIPVLHDVKKNTFYCKLSDYRESTGTDQVDEIGLIHLESVGLNSFVYLMQVANIYFKLKTDSVFYKDQDVYSISFNYKGDNKNEFLQLLELVEQREIKYEVTGKLLGEIRD